MIEPVSIDPPRAVTRVIASQRWSEVLFLHWRVAADVVAPLLPAGTRPDVHDGSSWVGLIAFRLSAATLGPIGPLPRVSEFVEVNVRLYAVDELGRRGVVFRSLEAASLPAVVAARAAFGLPYYWADTEGGVSGDHVHYATRRRRGGPSSVVEATFDDSIEVHDALSQFLTARWAMFTHRLGRTRYRRNSHEPWLLHPAALTRVDDELVSAAGLPGIALRPPDSVLYSPGVTARFGS